MPDPTMVQTLADFASRASTSLPPEVESSVRQRVLDVVGLCLAATTLETSAAIRSFVEDEGSKGRATAIGAGATSPAWAAFTNGVLAHSLDYDDTHLPSILHPSASVVPAALAVGQATGAHGRSVVRAIAAGLEICVRLGMAGYDREANNSVYFEHGQHATSICGAIGAAAAAAVLLKPESPMVADAMGIAVSMASGVIEANRTGGTVKRIHCGWSAHAGVVAAHLASKGITGPPTALEGRFGFFRAFLRGEVDASAVTDGLGANWEVPGIFFKPYPANHFTHAGIDAARRLAQAGLRPWEVARAELYVSTPTVRTIGEPLDVKRAPMTGYQAQFSGPYTVAAALFGGSGLGLGLDDFTDELAQDPERRELMARVSVHGSDACDAVYPYQFPAILVVETKDGAELVEEVMVNRGGPGDPLSDEDLYRKFLDNASRAALDRTVENVARRCLALDELEDVGELMGPLATLDGSTPH